MGVRGYLFDVQSDRVGRHPWAFVTAGASTWTLERGRPRIYLSKISRPSRKADAGDWIASSAERPARSLPQSASISSLRSPSPK